MFFVRKVEDLYAIQSSHTEPLFRDPRYIVVKSGEEIYESSNGKKAVEFAQQCSIGHEPVLLKGYMHLKTEKILQDMNPNYKTDCFICVKDDVVLISALDKEFVSYQRFTEASLVQYNMAYLDKLPPKEEWIPMDKYLAIFDEHWSRPKAIRPSITLAMLNQIDDANREEKVS